MTATVPMSALPQLPHSSSVTRAIQELPALLSTYFSILPRATSVAARCLIWIELQASEDRTNHVCVSVEEVVRDESALRHILRAPLLLVGEIKELLLLPLRLCQLFRFLLRLALRL